MISSPFVISLLLIFGDSLSAPAEEPVRVELPVYDQTEEPGVISTYEPENPPGVQTVSAESKTRNKFEAVLGNKLSSNGGQILTFIESDTKIDYFYVNSGIFSAPVTTLEGALLETEGLPSKKLSIKENFQNVVAGIFKPTPLVDSITEEDKYGNDGQKFSGIGRAIVGGAASLSNLVNSLLEVPGNVFRKITRTATEKLNNIGGKLIGL